MAGEHPRYLSYLLRLWQETGGEEPVWRASLEDTVTSERIAFTDVASLVTFIEKQLIPPDLDDNSTAIAYQIEVARTFSKYWLSHPARKRLALTPILRDASCFNRLSAIWRSRAML
jgi:hypothetical protein